MRILIVGSEGFLGSYICIECKNLGLDYIPINRTNWTELLNAGLANWFILNKITTIIFCCGYSSRFKPQEIEQIAELEAVNILLKETNARFIYLSSALVYGLGNSNLSFPDLSESSAVEPTGAYGMYKRIIERLILQANEKNCIMRLVSCIGKRKKSGLFTSIENQLRNKNSKIKMLHGNTTRDYLWVGYAAKLIVNIAINNKATGIFNIGSGKGIKVNEIIGRLASHYDVIIKKIEFGKLMNEDPERLVLDISKTKRNIPLYLSKEVFNSDQISRYIEEKV